MNVAVVGCGYWGPNLIRNFCAIPECHMDVCCDLDPKKLERMRSLYPHVRVTRNFRDMLQAKEIDAVAIATPVYTHYPLAKACLQAGKHVMIEKPMASSRSECLDLIRIAKEMDRVLMVGHTFEYTAAVNKIKNILKEKLIGDVLYISSERLNLGLFQPDINVVWDLAPHDISIILYLLEKEPVSVNGQGKAHYCQHIEDVATATLFFDSGEVAFLHQSWLDPYKIRKMTIVGTKKMLVYDDIQMNEKIKIFDKGVDMPRQYDTYAEFHFAYHYGDIYSPRIEEQEPIRCECEHFLECICEKKTPRSDGYSGLRVVTIIEAICRSMHNSGHAISLHDAYSHSSEPDNQPQRQSLNIS